MATRIAINGFGRIGRNIVRAIYESGRKDIDVVAINDLGPVETNAHLMRFDSVHGRFPKEVTVDGDTIKIEGGDSFKVFAERDPKNLPWGDLDIDIVMFAVSRVTIDWSIRPDSASKPLMLSNCGA